ncbi:MAG: electron transfer flavoprotein subunit beta/FixA family protein [Actinobacteria bacterium]|nr:electron transfer flavoprotein subunit beta/FixA family protein [Actinomycetota bacterium]
MKIVVPVKRVPDTAGEKKLSDDMTSDRESVEAVLNPLDEWSIETALQLKEAGKADEIVALCIGPEAAQATVRKALSYGLDAAVQVTDEGVHGSDALGIARILAKALEDLDADLVIFGSQSTDARTCIVPAAVAELLNRQALTFARHIEIDGETVTVHREHEEGWDVVESSLPAIVSVVEAINEPRYPSFKGIMAAKSKPLDTKSLADIGVDPSEVGLANAAAQIQDAQPRPPKEAGTIVEDDGSGSVGASALADWLQEKKFI